MSIRVRRTSGNSHRDGRNDFKENTSQLSRDSLLEGLVRYLAVRIADQQQVIANLVTVDSEQRLGKMLLQLARTLGKKYQQSTRIELKISHDELSEIVGHDSAEDQFVYAEIS
jgi:CRP-like cAMP-binding protein